MKRLALCISMLAAGCAINPRPAFDATSGAVHDRTGFETAWIRTEVDENAVLTRVREMLRAPLTARRAAQIALLNNRALQAKIEELGVAQANIAAAGLPSNPEVESFLGWPSERGRAKKFDLGFGTDVLDLFVLPARKRLANLEMKQAKALAGDAILQTAAEAQRHFVELAALTRMRDGLEIAQDVEQALFDFAEARHRAGTLADLDLARHRAALSEMHAERGAIERDMRVAREEMNRVMGLWGKDVEWTIDVSDLTLRAGGDAGDLERVAIEQRFDLAAARAAVELLEGTLRLQKKTRFLPAGIRAGVKVEREGSKGERVRVVGPDVRLQLPIFNPGRAESNRIESLYFQAQRLLEDGAVRARAEVRSARDRYRASSAIVTAYESSVVPERQRIQSLTLAQYNMMLRGADELLEAKKEVVMAEKKLVDALRDAALARIDLALAVGGALPDEVQPGGVK